MSCLTSEKFSEDAKPMEAAAAKSDEVSPKSKRGQRLTKVAVRRKVEDILEEKNYQRLLADPYEDFLTEC